MSLTLIQDFTLWGGYVLSVLALGGLAYAFVGIVFDLGSAKNPVLDFARRGASSREVLGEQVAQHAPWDIQEDVFWANLGGVETSVGEVYYRALVYGLLAATVLLVYRAPAALTLPVLAFYWPIQRVKSAAHKARSGIVRQIPEIATLMAAELAAGNPPDLALRRVASGPMGRLVEEAVALSGQSGRPLFSRGQTRGTLVEVFERTGEPILRSFATQIDRVAEIGTRGAQLMDQVAQAITTEHQTRIRTQTRELDSKLTIATGLFFFFPLSLFILAALGAPLMNMFGGG